MKDCLFWSLSSVGIIFGHKPPIMPESPSEFLLTDIHRCYPVALGNELFLTGNAMAEIPVLENAWIHIQNGKIVALGKTGEGEPELTDNQLISCKGRLVLPGFVDSHTHLVFPRTREQEYVDRIKGLTYEEIAERGGGILNSARATAHISEEQLLNDTLIRAHEILALGTTTVEIKSGYGLSFESEMKLLRVARQIGERTPLRVRTTFLGAHAIPRAYASDRKAYIKLVTDEMLPAVVAEGLADHIDVFCDKGFFTPEETLEILSAGEKMGLPGKIHANELANSGGIQTGVQAGCWSVDHLEQMGDAEIDALRGSQTVPCVLPTVAFFLGIPYAPARAMINAGLPLALATDYNPGSSPGGSMPFVMSLACNQLRMLPEEALVASTLNAAYALRMSDTVGSLAPGKMADLIVTKPLESLAALPYYYATNLVERVMIGGKWVFGPSNAA